MQQDGEPGRGLRFLAARSLAAQQTLANALREVWQLLIFRDHWQGEFCVALFGAVGWSIIAITSDDTSLNKPQFAVLSSIMSEPAWVVLFLGSGVTQLTGMRLRNSWLRLAGATGVFVGLLCVYLAVLSVAPWTLGLSTYAASIAIEACAIIYQTSRIVRLREYPRWIFKLLA